MSYFLCICDVFSCILCHFVTFCVIFDRFRRHVGTLGHHKNMPVCLITSAGSRNRVHTQQNTSNLYSPAIKHTKCDLYTSLNIFMSCAEYFWWENDDFRGFGRFWLQNHLLAHPIPNICGPYEPDMIPSAWESTKQHINYIPQATEPTKQWNSHFNQRFAFFPSEWSRFFSWNYIELHYFSLGFIGFWGPGAHTTRNVKFFMQTHDFSCFFVTVLHKRYYFEWPNVPINSIFFLRIPESTELHAGAISLPR